MRRPAERGYTLVALLVGITVMSILVAAVLPLASAEAQRTKEDELIFRGLQYAEGIRVFRKRFGRYPTSLKEMLDVKPRSLRKLWKAPMTGQADWVTITLTAGQKTVGSGTVEHPFQARPLGVNAAPIAGEPRRR